MLMGSLVMEEKQLDFNRPLISIRRPIQTSESETKPRSFDSKEKNMLPPSPPVYKSDIKSGPIRNPGTVPFQWENKPGKPKDERKPVLECLVEPHFVPKLPPGRLRDREELSKKVETRANGNVDDAKSYDGDEDTYLDATDSLSRSESFFLNYSNDSGLDSPGMLVEPFGTLSSDRQTQDLMMGRFLPAAKALTSETAKKPPKPEEPPRQMTKKVVVVKEKQNPYRFHHSPDQEEEDGNRSSIMAFGVCGLVPQLCLKTSFGVLNPVPSSRMQTQKAVSVRRMRSKYQDSTTPCNVIVNEDKRKQKQKGSVAQGPALQVSSVPERKEKRENISTTTTSREKTSKNFGEFLASDDNTWNSSSEEPVAEKTLYVDIVHSVDKRVQEESKEQSSLAIVPVEDVENMIGSCEEANSPPKSSTEEMNAKGEEDFIEFSSRNYEECPDHAIVAEIVTKEKIDLEEQVKRKTMSLESSRVQHRSSYHIVPPPPLPKAPSDSWLKRTLPTIQPKNISFPWLQSIDSEDHHFTKTQANPKWETMVKTSNTQQGFVCFSKETLNPIPEA